MNYWPRIREAIISAWHAVVDFDTIRTKSKIAAINASRATAKEARAARDRQRQNAKANARIAREQARAAKVAARPSNSPRAVVPAEEANEPIKKKRRLPAFVVPLAGVIIFIRMFCGIFVVQPLGALPNGATVLYWRSGLNLPFIASADGILGEGETGVSLLGRAVVISAVSKVIEDRRIATFGYMDFFYLWSTGGKRYER